jgi:hypothetical protein
MTVLNVTAEADSQAPARTSYTGPYSSLRPTWIGFAFALLYLGAEIAGVDNPEEMDLWASLVSIVGWVYWLTCVSRFHKILAELSPYENGEPTYPFTPRQSVLYHIIPLINFYWVFRWPREMDKFLRERTSVDIGSGWGMGAILFVAFLFGGFGLFPAFGVGLYISGQPRQAIAEHEVVRGAAGVFG